MHKRDRTTPPKPSTPAQDAARVRAFHIVRLRGLWCSVSLIQKPWRRRLARWLIDRELIDLGAAPHTPRVKKQAAEREALYARLEAEERANRQAASNQGGEIPF